MNSLPLTKEYVIDIVGLHKSFQRQATLKGGYTTIKSLFLGLGKSAAREKVQSMAISDLTLRIRKGASVGIIGRNGSGKSTLLKLITGIYRPTKGKVVVSGRVAALIELGAGFHPDFTGRENLYLGGVMHGLSRRQIEERFDEIVDFAELSHVIDDPIRTYSSGMFMRLGFSLAVHTDPDLLLVDEVLAVGDAAFVAKCKERISRLRAAEKTLLLVSHDLEAVERWCDEVVWLDKGKVKDRGDPRRVIDHYRQNIEDSEERELIDAQHEQPIPVVLEDAPVEDEKVKPQRWGSREVEITQVRLLNAEGDEHALFHSEEGLIVEAHYRTNEATSDIVFGIAIHRSDGLMIHGSNSSIEQVIVPRLAERGVVRYVINRLGLLDGQFFIDVAVHRQDGYPYDYLKCAREFVVRSAFRQIGIVVPVHSWEFVEGAQ
jgi:ABC-type polysaccharide/polyol phosphate transport system ATPase subunit